MFLFIIYCIIGVVVTLLQLKKHPIQNDKYTVLGLIVSVVVWPLTVLYWFFDMRL